VVKRGNEQNRNRDQNQSVRQGVGIDYAVTRSGCSATRPGAIGVASGSIGPVSPFRIDSGRTDAGLLLCQLSTIVEKDRTYFEKCLNSLGGPAHLSLP
jgi:hypothetical protein